MRAAAGIWRYAPWLAVAVGWAWTLSALAGPAAAQTSARPAPVVTAAATSTGIVLNWDEPDPGATGYQYTLDAGETWRTIYGPRVVYGRVGAFPAGMATVQTITRAYGEDDLFASDGAGLWRISRSSPGSTAAQFGLLGTTTIGRVLINHGYRGLFTNSGDQLYKIRISGDRLTGRDFTNVQGKDNPAVSPPRLLTLPENVIATAQGRSNYYFLDSTGGLYIIGRATTTDGHPNSMRNATTTVREGVVPLHGGVPAAMVRRWHSPGSAIGDTFLVTTATGTARLSRFSRLDLTATTTAQGIGLVGDLPAGIRTPVGVAQSNSDKLFIADASDNSLWAINSNRPGDVAYSYTIPGLTPGAEYRVQLRAAYAVGYSEASAAVAATMPGVPPAQTRAAPGQVTGLLALPAAGRPAVTLSWLPPGGAVTGYEYSDNGGDTWHGLPGRATTAEISGGNLSPGGVYSFQVRAINGVAAGAPSGTAHTPAQAPPGTPYLTLLKEAEAEMSASASQGSLSSRLTADVLPGELFADGVERKLTALTLDSRGRMVLAYTPAGEISPSAGNAVNVAYESGATSGTFRLRETLLAGFGGPSASIMTITLPQRMSDPALLAGQRMKIRFLRAGIAPGAAAGVGLPAVTDPAITDPVAQTSSFAALLSATPGGPEVTQMMLTAGVFIAVLFGTRNRRGSGKLMACLGALVLTPWIPALLGYGSLILSSILTLVIIAGAFAYRVLARPVGV